MSNPKSAYNVVSSLSVSLKGGSRSLGAIPGLIVRIVNEELWREFYCEPIQKLVTFDSFEAFVIHELPDGLDTDIATLKNLCRDNIEARDAIDRACKREGGTRTDLVDIVNEVERPSGNARDAAIRRLRKHSELGSDNYREDVAMLYREVLSGKRSPHNAMVTAGFRKVDTPDTAALKALRKAENPDEVWKQFESERATC